MVKLLYKKQIIHYKIDKEEDQLKMSTRGLDGIKRMRIILGEYCPHNELLYQCYDCEQLFNCCQDAVGHLLWDHPNCVDHDDPLIDWLYCWCSLCHKKLDDYLREQIDRSSEFDVNGRLISSKCGICDRPFLNQKMRNLHMVATHRVRTYWNA